MYTNSIIGSYNAIANSEHCSMIMKPPIRRQPKKTHSKEGHTHHSRGNSEEGTTGTNSVNSILSPVEIGVEGVWGCLPGLEVLAGVGEVVVEPDRVFSPEVSKIGFTISIEKAQSQRKSSSLAHPPVPHLVGGRDTGGSGEEEKMRVLFKCVPGEVPAEGGSSRALVLEGVGGSGVVALHTHTPYCCSWYQTLESTLTLSSGEEFGKIIKTGFGPCKCHRKFELSCSRREGGKEEKWEFSGESRWGGQGEVVILQNNEAVGRITPLMAGLKHAHSSYKVTFLKNDTCSSVKLLFVLFAVNLHIAFAEKLNTCFGMGLCGVAASSVMAWVLCLL